MSLKTDRFAAIQSIHGTRFNEWRAVRPFLGGLLLALGGVTIAAKATVLAPASVGFTLAGPVAFGLVAAAVVFCCGTFALANPTLSGTFGVIGVISAIVSLVGIVTFVGVVCSLLGGNLCYAWQPDAEN